MSITLATAAGALSKLVGLGLSIYRLSKGELNDVEKHVDVLQKAIDTGGQFASLLPANATSRIQARWIALTAAAFGDAWSRHFSGRLAYDPNLNLKERQQDVALHQEVAISDALTNLPTLGENDLRAQLDLIGSLTGDPLLLPFYNTLWRAFRKPDHARYTKDIDKRWTHPLINLESKDEEEAKQAKEAQARFERAFRLAYAEALASPIGQDVRAFVSTLNGDKTACVRQMLVQDISTWGSRNVFGNQIAGLPQMPLQTIYVEPFATRRILSGSLGARPPSRAIRQTIEDLIKVSNFVVVAGDFGQGKSLTARVMACEAAAKYLQSETPAQRRMPIYIRAAEAARNHQPLLSMLVRDALWQQFRGSTLSPLSDDDAAFSMPEKNVRALCLIDGLDELSLNEKGLEQFFDHILRQVTPEHQVVVFSRPAALPLRWLSKHAIPLLDLESFTTEGEMGGQVVDWLQRWHQCSDRDPESARLLAAQQQERLREQGLLDLARTPILLLMIARTWDQVAEAHERHVPLRRVDLYERFCQQIARGRLDGVTEEHQKIARASEGIYEALSKKKDVVLRTGKDDAEGTTQSMAAMLWLMSRVAWYALCLEQQGKVLNRGRMVTFLADKLEVNDEDMQSLICDGLLLTMQASFSRDTDRMLFGHQSFRDFLVARFWEHQLHVLIHRLGTRNAEDSLLEGRFLDRGDERLSFLKEMLGRWESRGLTQLNVWAQQAFHDETVHPPTYREDQRAYLREAALAIGSFVQPMVPSDELRLRSLLASFWLRGETAIVRAEGALLREARLARTDLTSAQLSRANLTKADLQGAVLQGALLTGANLEGTILERAYLRDADLRRVTSMREARLQRANLEYAQLQEAQMQMANLEGANLENASLQFAHLEGTNLRDANLLKTDLRNAVYDRTTRWPDGFSPESAGVVLARSRLLIGHVSQDRIWLDHLLPLLSPLVPPERLLPYDENQIPSEDELAETWAALLLVSADFLAADAIQKTLLPLLIHEEQQKHLQVLWLPVSPSNAAVGELKGYRALQDPNLPLSSLSEADCEQVLSEACLLISKSLSSVYASK